MNNLKCSVCGYIPDRDDIEKTSYRLDTCKSCGRKNVCDLCRYYDSTGQEYCMACRPLYDLNGKPSSLLGAKRKFWLKEELD